MLYEQNDWTHPNDTVPLFHFCFTRTMHTHDCPEWSGIEYVNKSIHALTATTHHEFCV